MRINSVPALFAQRQLGINELELSKQMQQD